MLEKIVNGVSRKTTKSGAGGGTPPPEKTRLPSPLLSPSSPTGQKNGGDRILATSGGRKTTNSGAGGGILPGEARLPSPLPPPCPPTHKTTEVAVEKQ